MNGRWYAGQQLEVSPWDGVTNYQIEETDQERESRLSAWEKFLEDGDEPKGETQKQPVSSGNRTQNTVNCEYFVVNRQPILCENEMHEKYMCTINGEYNTCTGLLVQKLFNVNIYCMKYFGHEIFAIYGTCSGKLW